jgi:hypothetical protein
MASKGDEGLRDSDEEENIVPDTPKTPERRKKVQKVPPNTLDFR